MSASLDPLRSPLGASPEHLWLLLCHCPGLAHLGVADPSTPEAVAAVLAREGYDTLSQLLTQPLPPRFVMVCCLDMRYGRHPGVCIERSGVNRARALTGHLHHSITLTDMVRDAQVRFPAESTALFLLPQTDPSHPMVSLFPATGTVLAGLPGMSNLARPVTGERQRAQVAAILNAVELTATLHDARPARGRGLQLLMAENCLLPSLETAYQLHTLVDWMAAVNSQPPGWLGRALRQAISQPDEAPYTPLSLMRGILEQTPDGMEHPREPGVSMSRVSHLYFLCSQFVSSTQAIWKSARNLQTAYLRSRFNPNSPDESYRDLFDFMHQLQFELNRLPFETMERVDTVQLGELRGAVNEILDMQRNQPVLLVPPQRGGPEALRASRQALPVYLPTGPLRPEYALLSFGRSGWWEFIALLNASRAQ